jgi:hypothetical protein
MPPVLMGEWFRSPIGLCEIWLSKLQFWDGSGIKWLVRYGTALDMLSLIYISIEIPIVARYKTRPRTTTALAIPFWAMRALDWSTAGRLYFGWTPMESLWVEETPMRLFAEWKAHHKDAYAALEALGPTRVAQLIALLAAVAYTIALFTPRRRSRDLSLPESSSVTENQGKRDRSEWHGNSR